jgi:hypothetical protein
MARRQPAVTPFFLEISGMLLLQRLTGSITHPESMRFTVFNVRREIAI